MAPRTSAEKEAVVTVVAACVGVIGLLGFVATLLAYVGGRAGSPVAIFLGTLALGLAAIAGIVVLFYRR
jgi:hypothetical protein